MCIQEIPWLRQPYLLCTDNDDTIGCTGSIDCNRRGILQHLDIINIISCQEVDIGHWHTIYYIERIITTI